MLLRFEKSYVVDFCFPVSFFCICVICMVFTWSYVYGCICTLTQCLLVWPASLLQGSPRIYLLSTGIAGRPFPQGRHLCRCGDLNSGLYSSQANTLPTASFLRPFFFFQDGPCCVAHCQTVTWRFVFISKALCCSQPWSRAAFCSGQQLMQSLSAVQMWRVSDC